MKVIAYKKYGPPDVLHVTERKDPTPKPEEILIRVRAAEVTKADCELRSFNFPVKWFWLPLRLATGVFRPYRKVLGSYFAGEVAAIGDQVTKFKIGDKIFGGTGLRFGAYGELVCVPQSYTLAHMPENQSFEQASAVPLGGLNALHFMRLANIKAGERILINGAGGSIGTFALQIAKDMGAEVTVVDAPHKEQMLREIGAVEFFDYTKENFRESGLTYDVIFDMVAASSVKDCAHMLNPKGRYLTGNPRIGNMLACRKLTKSTDKTATFAFAKESVEELEALKTLIEQDRIAPVLDQVLPMEAAAQAHRLVETEQRIGAIVLSITP